MVRMKNELSHISTFKAKKKFFANFIFSISWKWNVFFDVFQNREGIIFVRFYK